MSNPNVRAEAERHLRALVGREDAVLREDQWSAIEALAVERRRALVVQRTGWGKSAVYFVATLLLREQGAGPTVIVSPLLALMRNQIAAAERAGIRAVTINSTNIEAWDLIQDQIRAGEVDVLVVDGDVAGVDVEVALLRSLSRFLCKGPVGVHRWGSIRSG